MTTSPRKTLTELGRMLAQQARLLKAEGALEARKVAEAAAEYLGLARGYPLHQPIPVRVQESRDRQSSL